MNAYDRIADILRYLDESHTAQPDLASLAERAGLSSSHFHRLFVSWAGVTPKDFLQCLTVADVKRRLREGEGVLETALEAGLSGPGRLHDLCVHLEAASPGEWKSGGAGWNLIAGVADSPFGSCLIGEGPRGICHLTFPDPEALADEWDRLQATWPGAQLRRDDAAARRLAKRVFRDRDETESESGARDGLRAFVRGTPFQVRVWRALLEIPAGTLVTYGRLAARVDRPSSARAVGNAVGQNPLGYLIPCHRVIRGTGAVGHYRWGTVRKRAMLIREGASSFRSNPGG